MRSVPIGSCIQTPRLEFVVLLGKGIEPSGGGGFAEGGESLSWVGFRGL